ncbi:FAD-binding oxidoreductase [Amycolatopsis vastitatis]|uniref:FAD-binding PCMH-type domain-containing protein n=1 Tax=Amycolatopsis vastitatis TaxID=1905142 RepID=A0A229SYI0_9PSEU|nr:FAD-binding oxidoreductase [Amycolatopsis vastitatis]OXM63559.1 hypothetical protein CF165_30645 [Amycolatopsis vastitatis]
MNDRALTADLRGLLAGRVSDAPAALAAHETDYGQVVYRRPAVVVRPDGPADVAATLRYATKHGIPVSPRGTGHSLRGQSTNDGGVVLDLTGLDHLSVDAEAWRFRCGPGARWRAVVAAAARHGLVPPVLTSYPHVTVGGTHSAGSWGESSFRHGAQADNCTGLEVVTGAGERLRCGPETEPELFGHVLGGMGQFAVITEVEHRLRAYRPIARTYPLHYRTVEEMLADLRRLVAPGTPLNSLESTIEAAPDGTWRHRVLATLEVDDAESAPPRCPVAGLVARQGPPSDQPTATFLARPRAGEVPPVPGVAQPWVVTYLPWSRARVFLSVCRRRLHGLLAGADAMVLWPARRAVTATPMLRVPDSEAGMVMVALFPRVATAKLPGALALLGKVSDLALELGGTRHLATWVHFDLPRWRLHFGSEWPKVNELKHRYDPAGILNPGFIEYEPSPVVSML